MSITVRFETIVTSAYKYLNNYVFRIGVYLLNKRIGHEIFTFYKKNKMLNNPLRIKIVNATCGKLTEVFGSKVPEAAKRDLGEAVINTFPNLKDPAGISGYVSNTTKGLDSVA